MHAYPHYRDSGVEWLGEVPEHWGAARVTDVFEARSGGTPSTAEEAYWEGDIPWVSAKDMKALRIRDTEDHISEEAVRASATSLVPAGTVLLVARSGILKHTLPVGLSEREVAINQDIKGLIPREALVEPLYFVYCLNGFQSVLLTLWRQQGATVESLDFDTVRSTALPLPPLDEQRAIAAFLDRETERIDALVAKKRLLIERLEEYRSALITRTVTRGLPPEAARAAGLEPSPRLKPSGVEWLGEVPEHWEVAPLYTRYSVDLGKMLREDRTRGDHLVSYLRNVDVQWDQINFEDLPEIDIAPAEFERYTVLHGDLLVCEGGEVGRAAIVPQLDGPIAYQKALHRLRPNDAESPRFMFYTFRFGVAQGIFEAGGNPNTILHLTGEMLRRYRFPRPPHAEQVAIATYLDGETARIDGLTSEIERAIERSQEYRTALITAAVTGKIDVRE